MGLGDRRGGRLRLVRARGGDIPPRQSPAPTVEGQLYAILRNPIYVGDIPHKDKVYPGNHAAIIERDLWDAVQQRLASNIKGARATRGANASLLTGLLFDPEGQPLIPVHSAKGKVRYHYYVSKAQHHRRENRPAPALRLPAREIEEVVRQELGKLLGDPLGLIDRLGLTVQPDMLEPAMREASSIRQALGKCDRVTTHKLIERIAVHPDRLELTLTSTWLADILGPTEAARPTTALHILAVRLTRSGRVLRLVDEAGAARSSSTPDDSMIRLVLTARRWWAELAKGELDITTLSARENVSASWMTRVVRLAFLAPEVVDAVLAGRTKAGVDAKALLTRGAIPAVWDKQAELLLPRKGK